jgi:hypothetical protein
MEGFYKRLSDIKEFAARNADPISNKILITHALTAMAKSGLLNTDIDEFCKTDEATWTFTAFQTTFTKANKIRLSKLTAQTGGYHGAHAATTMPITQQPPANPASTNIVADGKPFTLYYCWSHGLSRNAKHTSALCNTRLEGHRTDATFTNTLGGSNTFQTGSRRRPKADTIDG